MTEEERKSRRKKETYRAMIVMAVFVVIAAGVLTVGILAIKKFLPSDAPSETQAQESVQEDASVAEEPLEEPSEEPIEDVPAVDEALEQAKVFVSQMTLEQKVAQMFIITPDALANVRTATAAGEKTKESYQAKPVGGLVYFGGNLKGTEQTQKMLSNMQEYAAEIAGLPVFLCVSEEGGKASVIASNSAFGVTDIGNMNDLAALETDDLSDAFEAGKSIGTYLKELGFNVDFAPVADVLTNPENTAIAARVFGTDPVQVGMMAHAMMQGLDTAGIKSVVKYFPGQGGTAGDCEKELVKSERTLEELTAQELVPFQDVISYDAPFIMAGHIAVPNVTGNELPCSLSEYMLGEILRGQLGYTGVIVTAPMNAPAITGSYDAGSAAVMAITAGADMVLLPENYEKAYEAVLEAVGNGTLTEERIDESVARIVKVKQKM